MDSDSVLAIYLGASYGFRANAFAAENHEHYKVCNILNMESVYA